MATADPAGATLAGQRLGPWVLLACIGRGGLVASSSSTDELAGIVKADYPRWGQVIKRNGIKAE